MNKIFGIRLTDDERQALSIWATDEGLRPSAMARRILRLAIRQEAAKGTVTFPAPIMDRLNIQVRGER